MQFTLLFVESALSTTLQRAFWHSFRIALSNPIQQASLCTDQIVIGILFFSAFDCVALYQLNTIHGWPSLTRNPYPPGFGV